MVSYQSFEQMEVWKSARELRKRISTLAKFFPAQEKYRLSDQIIRSSRSVPANLSEGFGRFHYQENLQYCRQARGSLSETLEHLITAFDEGYIDEQVLKEQRAYVEDCWKKLNGYISYLSKAAMQSK